MDWLTDRFRKFYIDETERHRDELIAEQRRLLNESRSLSQLIAARAEKLWEIDKAMKAVDERLEKEKRKWLVDLSGE